MGEKLHEPGPGVLEALNEVDLDSENFVAFELLCVDTKYFPDELMAEGGSYAPGPGIKLFLLTSLLGSLDFNVI